MGLFDDLNKNFYYTKKLTYKDVVKMLEDSLAAWEQKDTENVSFCNQKENFMGIDYELSDKQKFLFALRKEILMYGWDYSMSLKEYINKCISDYDRKHL